MLRRALATSTALLLAMTANAPAFAQQLEEITVTARRVEESLMQVPLAITAFSAATIETVNLKQVNDLALMTPSFTFVNQSGISGRNSRGGGAATFRGLYLGGGGGNVFVDGAPVQNAPADFGDLQTVEVLKGPQAAYFGRATFSGALNFVIREPGNEFKGRVALEYGSFGNNEQALSVEGPLVEDKLSFRVSARHYYRGGQYKNWSNTSEMLGSQDTKSVSLSLVYKPSDNFKAKAYGNLSRYSDGTAATFAILRDQFNCTPAAGAAGASARARAGYYCGELPTLNQLPAHVISADSQLTPYIRNLINSPEALQTGIDPSFIDHFGLENLALQTILRMDYEFQNGFTISSLSSYQSNKTGTVYDGTYRGDGHLPNLLYNLPGVTGPRPPTQSSATFPQNFTFMRFSTGFERAWNQEVRVTSPQDWRYRFVVGANYTASKNPGSATPGVDTKGSSVTGNITESMPHSKSVFGGLYVDILRDELTVSVEARRQWEHTKQIPITGLGLTLLPPASRVPVERLFKSFVPRFAIDWKFADNHMAYALFSKGISPGGVNAVLITSPPEALEQIRAVVPDAGLNYRPETLENYEFGIKSTFLDNRARATFTVYYDRYLDGQASAQVPIRTQNVSNLVTLIVNTATATLKGFELEGEFAVTDKLTLSGNMGLNDSKISTTNLAVYSCSDCINVMGNPKAGLGNRMPTVPKWTWTVSGQWKDTLVNNWDYFGRVDWVHRGMSFIDYTALTWIGASEIVNARIGVRNDTLNIEAYVTNLLNDSTAASAIGGGGFNVMEFAYAGAPLNQVQTNAIRISPPQKRQFGIRASYNF